MQNAVPEDSDPPVSNVPKTGPEKFCPPPPPAAPSKPLAADAISPPTIPDHTLLRRVGGGSYGDVWLARNVMGTYRAVKIVYRQRFQNERPFEREFHGIQTFEPVSRTHESFVNVLHVGRDDEQGCFYYVMELADDELAGPDLHPERYTPKTLQSELRRRGRLPPEECVRIGLALSAGLGHLHQHDLIHRDIKPANIIFVHDVPKLADIGLVTEISEANSMVGTEGYIPPEGTGTPLADLYSLGKVLYEISTGKDRTEFPEPQTATEGESDDPATREFNEVTLRACQPDARTRYQTAGQMHQELLLLQSGKSVRHLRKVERRLARATRAGASCTLIAALAVAAYCYEAYHQRQYVQLAKEKTKLADEKTILAKDSQERLARAHVAQGMRQVEANDHFGALPWFAEALRLDQGNPQRAESHRMRISATLQHSPRLVQTWFHGGPLVIGEFSPDGKQVLTASEDGTARLWDVQTGQQVAVLPHAQDLQDAHFSPDGAFITTCDPKAARIWDATTGNPVIPPIGLAGTGVRVVFSADGRMLATGSASGSVCVWDAKSGAPLIPPMDHEGPIRGIAFSPDQKRLAVICCGGCPRIWDTATGKLVAAIPYTYGTANGIGFTLDGNAVFCVGTGPVIVGDAHTGAIKWRSSKHALNVYSAVLTPDGKRLITASEDQTARIWDLATGQEALAPLKHPQGLHNASASGDGQLIATSCHDGMVRIWDANTGEQVGSALRQADMIRHTWFSPSGFQVLTLGQDGLARLWEMSCLAQSRKLMGHDAYIHKMVLSPMDDRAATACADGTVGLWNLDDTSAPLALFKHQGYVLDVTFSPDRRQLATASLDGTARIWSTNAAAKQIPPLSPTGRVFRVVFNAKGDQVLTVSANPTHQSAEAIGWSSARNGYETIDGILVFRRPQTEAIAVTSPLWIQSWSAVTGKPIAPPRSLDNATGFAIFSQDRQRIVTSCLDKTMRIWDVTTTEPLSPPIQPGPSPVFLAEFSPDERRIVTLNDWEGGGRISTTAVVWDVSSGKAVSTPMSHHGQIFNAVFSPNGRWVVTAGQDDSARVWDALTGKPITPPLKNRHEVFDAQFSPDGLRVATGSGEKSVRLWDARTGEPLGPPMPQRTWVSRVLFARDGRRVLSVAGNTATIWDLATDRKPVEDLQLLAQLLSAHRVEPAGNLVPLETSEMRQAWQHLQGHYPADFAPSAERQAAWHREQADSAENGRQPTTAP